MLNTGYFLGRTVVISGASRGIGKDIALKLAKDGANVVVAAKTATEHPKLPGTVYTTADEIEKAGGKALPCVVDVRDEVSVQNAIEEAVKKFGGIDILINNASAFSLTNTEETSMKTYDLINNINTRGTFLMSKKCLPYLKNGNNPHILNISPPLSMESRWFQNTFAYTLAKFGMSMCVLGMHEEFRPFGIAVNALWPLTGIWTAAVEKMRAGEGSACCRKGDIIADAAYAMLSKNSRDYTGNFAIDEDVLRAEGITDMDQYAIDPNTTLIRDFFIPDGKYDHVFRIKTPGQGDTLDVDEQPLTGDDISQAMELFRKAITKEDVKTFNAIIEFSLNDDNDKIVRKVVLDLKNGSGSFKEGSCDTADIKMSLTTVDFPLLFTGQLAASTAFLSSRLNITGDLVKAQKLELLLTRMVKGRKSTEKYSIIRDSTSSAAGN